MNNFEKITQSPEDKERALIVPLTRGQYTIIDAEDIGKVCSSKWQASPRCDGKGWYAVARGGKRLHRIIMDASENEIVDHINGDGLDNRKCNLRLGTQSLNSVNRRATPGKYMRGVRRSGNGFIAHIKQNNRMRNLGRFETELDAHNAYLKEAVRLYGDWMPLPKPPEV